jgi:hypothetical protein
MLFRVSGIWLGLYPPICSIIGSRQVFLVQFSIFVLLMLRCAIGPLTPFWTNNSFCLEFNDAIDLPGHLPSVTGLQQEGQVRDDGWTLRSVRCSRHARNDDSSLNVDPSLGMLRKELDFFLKRYVFCK